MEDTSDKIIITISGIQHYIVGGADGVYTFSQNHPVGSQLYLQMQGGTGAFARTVLALDASMQVVGTVCSSDSYKARAFFVGDNPVKVEPATIVKYLPKAIEVSVRNIGQTEAKAYVYENQDDDEQAFSLTEEEMRGMRLSAYIEFMAGQDNLDNDALLNLARCVREYKDVCMQSISGEAIYERRNVAKALAESPYTELQLMSKEIYEAANDMAKTPFQVRAFEMTLANMRKQSAAEMEKYMKSLTFGSDEATITEEKRTEEIAALTNALKKSLEGKYAEVYDNNAELAKLVYYFKYSRRQVALLITRMLKLEALSKLVIAANKKEESEEECIDDERVKQAITKILEMSNSQGEPLMKNNSHWYSIYRVLAERGVGAGSMTGFVAYIGQLFPEGTRLKLDVVTLKKNNRDCFVLPVAKWTEAQAPVKGVVYMRFLEIAREFDKLL